MLFAFDKPHYFLDELHWINTDYNLSNFVQIQNLLEVRTNTKIQLDFWELLLGQSYFKFYFNEQTFNLIELVLPFWS